MTITFKANPDGVTGAIQVNGVDRLTVNSSGAVTASTNPATGLRSTALATMQKFADEFGSSLAASGYQKLPSGLIIQWGSAATSGAGIATWTYPIAFPNAALRVLAVLSTAAIATNPTVSNGVFTNTTANGLASTSGGTAFSGAAIIFLAIGH